MATIADQLQTRRNALFPSAPTMPAMPNTPAMPAATTTGGGLMVPKPPQPQMPQAPGYDDSAASNIAKITATDSPLMQQAAAAGMAGANRRGLINSSIAVGAAQGEVLKAATPIGIADANVNAQKNLQSTDSAAQMERLKTQLSSTEMQQARDIENQKFMQSANFANASEQQKNELAARMNELTTNITAQQALQTQNLSEESRRQNVQLAVQQAMQSAEFANLNAQQKNDIAAQMERLVVSGQQELGRLTTASTLEADRMKLQASIDTALQTTGAEQQRALANLQGDIQNKLQTQTDAAAMQRLGAQFAQDTAMADRQQSAQLQQIAASGDQNVRQALVQAQNAKEQLAMQLASGDKERVANTAVQIFSAEAAMRQSLLSNTAMPAGERSAYEAAISSLGDPVRAFINQLYGSSGATQQTGLAPPAVSVAPTGTGGLMNQSGDTGRYTLPSAY